MLNINVFGTRFSCAGPVSKRFLWEDFYKTVFQYKTSRPEGSICGDRRLFISVVPSGISNLDLRGRLKVPRRGYLQAVPKPFKGQLS